MAIRLDTAIIRGEINNEVRNEVTGKIWIAGRENDPIVLKLTGNCHRDLAGCHLTFRNPNVEPQPSADSLVTRQRGAVGDMTASRKVKVPTVSNEELRRIIRRKDAIPTRLANCIYLEWFSEENGRVVIESAAFDVMVSEPQWSLSADEEGEQLEENTKQMRDFIESVAQRMDRESDEDFEVDRPLDEFEWEERLRESDRITDAYMEALDKYRDDPHQEQRVAEAMGWEQLSSESEESEWIDSDGDHDDEISFFSESDDDDVFSMDASCADMDGDDEVDWDERHPLYDRMHNFSIRLHREAQEKGYMDAPADGSGDALSPVQNLVFACMELGAKLAGALNGLSRGIDPEPGLVIAWLKRGLPIVDRALSACEQSLAEETADSEWVNGARTELFEVRAGMLDLIQEFRRQLP